jgi:uncharacterized membrane protein YGL010W
MASLQYYFDHYENAHRHKGNRICHAIGIPLIIAALILLISTEKTQLGWILFGAGWAFQFIGHALERTWPEFLSNPIYLLIGPLYFIKKLTK